ncbi:MAG TPA: hypothetical protein PKB10_10255 [Tepidisphaeraceae bacterium]|nr:hypothetical protein [Tepidisphaeraceae bacterium]
MKHLVIKLGSDVIHLYVDDVRADALMKEAGKGKGEPLGGAYFFQKHKPHVDGGQYHLHIYEKKNQLFSINWDGTAHDASHGVTIPNRVYDALKSKFPSLALPANKRIATFDPSGLGMLTKIASVANPPLADLLDLQKLVRDVPHDQRKWPKS